MPSLFVKFNKLSARTISIYLSVLLSLTLTTAALSGQEFQFLTEDLPPYSYMENGQIKGISVEVVREMLKRLKYQDNITVTSWSRAYNLTLQDENYALFSTARDPSREKLFKWIGPLVPDRTVMFARKGSGVSIKTLNDARKVKSIGTYKDDIGESYLQQNGFKNLDRVVDDKLNLQKLVAGRIDLWIMSEFTGNYLANKAGLEDKIELAFFVNNVDLYLAFNNRVPDAEVSRWQKVLDDIKTDGTYDSILKRYQTRR